MLSIFRQPELGMEEMQRHSADSVIHHRPPVRLLLIVACIPYLTLCNSLMAEAHTGSDSASIRKANVIEADSLTLPLCKKSKTGTSISAVGVDDQDRITLILKTREKTYYRHAWPVSVLDAFPSGFDENDIYTKSGPPMTSVDVITDLSGALKRNAEKFGKIIGNHTIVMQQHFFRLLANCDIDFRGPGQGPRASVLGYLAPDKILVNNFSDDIPEEALEFRIYDSNSGEVLDKTLVRLDPYMLAMRASLPLGESANYVVLTERNVGERPIRSGARLLQLSPLQSLESIVFPYENVIVTAISKPVKDSEIKIALSGYPYMITCRVSVGPSGEPSMEILEDCTPPVARFCEYASDFQYFAPWVTWITNENTYVLHFWNRDLGWHMLDLAPYTVFDDSYFPEYYFSTASSTLLLHQSKRNRPVYLLRPALPRNAFPKGTD